MKESNVGDRSRLSILSRDKKEGNIIATLLFSALSSFELKESELE